MNVAVSYYYNLTRKLILADLKKETTLGPIMFLPDQVENSESHLYL